MAEKIEKIIREVYLSWKKKQQVIGEHPNEEELACFLEHKLSLNEEEEFKKHILTCPSCAEQLAAGLGTELDMAHEPALKIIEQAQALVPKSGSRATLEIVLGFAQKAIEIISTSGDVLLGNELIPAPLLRSRGAKDFKDEVRILKDFENTLVEARIENKRGSRFNLSILAKEKDTQKVIKDIRITLRSGETELESYLADAGKVTFENVELGIYTIELSGISETVATITLDIRAV